MASAPDRRGPADGPAGRAYLDVPYAEKDSAKALGARWDPTARRWYDPRPPTPGLDRWAARPDVPDLLPGEDRSFGAGLFVDLVPRSCWFTNVRSCVSELDWERLRRPVLRRAGYRCEACGAGQQRAARRGLEVHERWDYDDRTGVQSLRRLIALCPRCHLTTHFGYATVTGRAGEAFAHLCAVTGMSESEARDHIGAAEQLWIVRSGRVWELDLAILTGAGIDVRPQEDATDRGETAEQQLRRARLGETREAAVPPADRRSTGSLPPTATTGGPVAAAPPPVGADWARAGLGSSDWHGGPDDLARNGPGIRISHEAARRRQTEGAGADRSWRVGADGEAAVAEVLEALTTPSRLDRLRGRRPQWRVLHSVPIGTGGADIDHVLIGPAGVVTINTKHHRAGRLVLDGDELIVNGRATDYVPKARREAQRAHASLGQALVMAGATITAARLQVRPIIAVVGGRVLIESWAAGVAVVMTRQLVHALTSAPPLLDQEQVEEVFAVARYRPTWTTTVT